MEYGQFVKKLAFPAGFVPPTELRYEDVVATAIARPHLQDDVAGINASIDLIRRTRGGNWPTEPVTGDYNFVDLVLGKTDVNWSPGEAALRSVLLLDAAYRSAVSGQPEKV